VCGVAEHQASRSAQGPLGSRRSEAARAHRSRSQRPHRATSAARPWPTALLKKRGARGDSQRLGAAEDRLGRALSPTRPIEDGPELFDAATPTGAPPRPLSVRCVSLSREDEQSRRPPNGANLRQRVSQQGGFSLASSSAAPLLGRGRSLTASRAPPELLAGATSFRAARVTRSGSRPATTTAASAV